MDADLLTQTLGCGQSHGMWRESCLRNRSWIEALGCACRSGPDPALCFAPRLGDVARQKGWLVLSVLPEAVLWT